MVSGEEHNFWNMKLLGSKSGPTTEQLCDLGRVKLQASVPPSINRNNNSTYFIRLL